MIFQKDENEIIDYTLNWTNALNTADTITNSTFNTETGITNVATDQTTGSTTIRLGGGTPGTRYKITNTITTNDGETLKHAFYVRIVNV